MPKPNDGRGPPELTNGVLAAVLAWIRFMHLEIVSLYLARSWPQSILDVSEPRWRPTEVVDTDNVVRMDRRQRLVRWDRRPPNEIFLHGFVPIVTNENPDWSQTDLYTFAKSNVPSIFVSTTKTQWKENRRRYEWTPRTANTGIVYQYEIYAPGGVDVNESLLNESPWPNQMEVAFPGGIQNVYIRSARELHNGRIQRIWINPNFLDPNELQPIVSSSRTPQVMWRENHPDGNHKDNGRSKRSVSSNDDLMYGGDGDVIEDPMDDDTDNPCPLPDGLYSIESVVDDDFLLDLSKNEEGGIIHSHKLTGGLNQMWLFSYDDGRRGYKMKSKINSSLLFSWNSNANPKEDILRGYTESGSSNQYWSIEETIDGCYRLKNVENPNMILTAENHYNSYGGKNVVVATSDSGNNQKWRIRPISFQTIPDGYYYIFNYNMTDIAVDYSNENDYLIHGHNFLNNNNQEWEFLYDENKEAYKIKSGFNSALLLSWNSNAASKEYILRGYTESGSRNQYWRVEQNDNGSYRLRNLEDLSLIIVLCYKKNSAHGGLELIVHTVPDNDTDFYSKWTIVPINHASITDGDYYIFNKHLPNIVVDSSNQPDSLIHGHDFFGNDNQKWLFVYDGNRKAYKIKSGYNSALLLSWNSNASPPENLLRAYTESGSDNQYWRIQINKDGSYNLRNLHNTALFLAVVEENSPYGGKKLVVSPDSQTWNDWYLERIGEAVIPDGKYRIATKTNYKKVIDFNQDNHLIITQNLNLVSSEWEIKYDAKRKAYNVYSAQYNNLGWVYQNKNFYVKLANIDGPDHGDWRYFWTIEYSVQFGCYMMRSLHEPSHAVGYSSDGSVVSDTSTYSDSQLFHFIPI